MDAREGNRPETLALGSAQTRVPFRAPMHSCALSRLSRGLASALALSVHPRSLFPAGVEDMQTCPQRSEAHPFPFSAGGATLHASALIVWSIVCTRLQSSDPHRRKKKKTNKHNARISPAWNMFFFRGRGSVRRRRLYPIELRLIQIGYAAHVSRLFGVGLGRSWRGLVRMHRGSVCTSLLTAVPVRGPNAEQHVRR